GRGGRGRGGGGWGRGRGRGGQGGASGVVGARWRPARSGAAASTKGGVPASSNRTHSPLSWSARGNTVCAPVLRSSSSVVRAASTSLKRTVSSGRSVR